MPPMKNMKAALCATWFLYRMSGDKVNETLEAKA